MPKPAKGKAPGVAYIGPDKKGEINELRSALRDPIIDKDKRRKREVLRRVIGCMTMGIDVSKLFSDMILAVNTKDLVQKKMVYLYICNYAEQNPGLAILAINTLRKDYCDDSPIVRGLALRSAASLRLPSIVEYLLPMIKSGLSDSNPYVRKIAVMSILKLRKLSPQSLKEEDFVDKLYMMLRDVDVSVVTNAIVVLNELLEESGGIQVNKQIIYHLFNRIREYNEWQLCLMLELLLKYTPENDQEIFDFMNLLDERLKHSNSAVILGTTHVFLTLTQNMPHIHKQVCTRLRDPLLTLMTTSSAEVSYTILSHIKLLASREPSVFSPVYQTFFCRYTDLLFLKELKLDILLIVVNESNVRDIMGELGEYVADVDKDISRKAIRTIGQIIVRIPATAESGINSLLHFLDLEIDFVRAETFVVLKDILRKYENTEFCRTFLPSITRHWKSIDDPESKISFLWILGEYGDLIDSAPYIVENCIDTFEQEHYSVRAELLTTTMKLFFKRPPEVQKILGRLLAEAASDYSHANVRDRALFYYRLLSKDINEAHRVVVGKKALISHFSEEESSEFRDRLFDEFNTLSVVFNEPSEKFIIKGAGILGEKEAEEEEEQEEEVNDEQQQQQQQQNLLDVSETGGAEHDDDDEDEEEKENQQRILQSRLLSSIGQTDAESPQPQQTQPDSVTNPFGWM